MRAILTYHSIDDSGSPVSVGVDAFRRHVRWLAGASGGGRGGVRVTTVDELLRLPDADGHDGGGDAVAITFDDGVRSFADVAAPLLAEHGLPVTLFVVSDRAGATSAWPAAGRRSAKVPVFPLLDWPALARLAEGGGVTLGGHSRTHRDLTRVRGAALVDEIEGCAERIAAETGRRPRGFAYPFGAADGEAERAVARTYEWACTTDLRALAPDERPYRLPRLDAYYLRGAGVLESWGSAAFRRRLWLRARARGVRRGLASALGAA
ncbi:MAG TPA: polysaccharide deacetylase family protein [Gemmatimonadaceae bacterium]|nr:polysaccharide deacetylase family protein [Gemmatimonadaceae bacterium]